MLCIAAWSYSNAAISRNLGWSGRARMLLVMAALALGSFSGCTIYNPPFDAEPFFEGISSEPAIPLPPIEPPFSPERQDIEQPVANSMSMPPQAGPDASSNPVQDESIWTFQPPDVSTTTRQWTSIEEIEHRATHFQILPDRSPVALDVASLIARTLQHSRKQKQLEIQPTEVRQLVNKEYGAFDPAAFVRSQFDVQNLQQKQENNQVSVGIKKNHLYGGSLELSESIGVQDNVGNLRFADQGVAALNVIYTQELLRDGGRDIVLSRGLIASYQYDQRFAQSLSESSNLIQATITAYWQLYKARANYFLQQALTEMALKLYRHIEERSNLYERSTSSLEQARALYFEASAELVDSQTRILQAQDTLFRLVNDPSIDPNWTELITTEGPTLALPPFDIMSELSLAIQYRPEIKDRIAAIRQNAVDQQVSLNQLLPKLSLSIKSSLNGFSDNRNLSAAVNNLDQQPLSATAGANMEVYFNNRTAKAKYKESQLRASRLHLEYEDQIQAIRKDVLIALRVIQNATPKIELRNLTLKSRQEEIDAITSKIWVNPEEGVSIVGQLEQLFQAINRLVRTQQQLIEAKVELQSSIVDLQRAKGLLVNQSIIPTNMVGNIPLPVEALQMQVQQKPVWNRESRSRVIGEPRPDRSDVNSSIYP